MRRSYVVALGRKFSLMKIKVNYRYDPVDQEELRRANARRGSSFLIAIGNHLQELGGRAPW